MNHKQLLIILQMLCAMLFTKAQEVKTYFKTGEPKEQYTLLNDKKDGSYQAWYSNGNTSEKGNYNNGMLDGEWTVFFRNGSIARKTVWRNDSVYTFQSYYGAEKTLLAELFFENGLHIDDYAKSVATRVFYHDMYYNSILQTQVVLLFADSSFNDIKWGRKLFADSILFANVGIHAQNCIIKRYYKCGVIADSVVYKNSEEVFWLVTTYMMKDKDLPGKQMLYNNGLLASTYEYFKSITNYKYTEYHPNEFTKTYGVVYNGNRIGKWKHYNEAGKVIRTDTYKDGTLIKSKT